MDCYYPQRYEVGLAALHFIFYEDRRILVDILRNCHKIVEQCNEFTADWKKNLLLCFWCCCISFLKGSYTFFLLYYFLANLTFNGRRAKAKVPFRKTSWMRKCYLKNGFAKVSFWFDVSSKLIRWNAWDQFQTVIFKFTDSSLRAIGVFILL